MWAERKLEGRTEGDKQTETDKWGKEWINERKLLNASSCRSASKRRLERSCVKCQRWSLLVALREVGRCSTQICWEKRPLEGQRKEKGEQMTWLNGGGGGGLLCKWMKSLTSYTLRSLSALPVPLRRKGTGEEIRTSSQFTYLHYWKYELLIGSHYHHDKQYLFFPQCFSACKFN